MTNIIDRQSLFTSVAMFISFITLYIRKTDVPGSVFLAMIILAIKGRAIHVSLRIFAPDRYTFKWHVSLQINDYYQTETLCLTFRTIIAYSYQFCIFIRFVATINRYLLNFCTSFDSCISNSIHNRSREPIKNKKQVTWLTAANQSYIAVIRIIQ